MYESVYVADPGASDGAWIDYKHKLLLYGFATTSGGWYDTLQSGQSVHWRISNKATRGHLDRKSIHISRTFVIEPTENPQITPRLSFSDH